MLLNIIGDPNSYSSFKDIFEHRYLYNVNNPWPEGEVGYGPFNRPVSNRSNNAIMNRSMYAGENPFPKIGGPRESPNNMMNEKNGDSLENFNSDKNIFGRTNPVHQDEGYLPSYGINHNNIKCGEDKQKADQYLFEKVPNGKGVQTHLDEDYLPSFDKNYMGHMKGRSGANTPLKKIRRPNTNGAVNSRSVDADHGRKQVNGPVGYMFRESQRLAAQGKDRRQVMNNKGQATMNPNTNFNPSQVSYNDPMANQEVVRIKERELAHGNHDIDLEGQQYHNEEGLKDVPENKT